MSDDPDIFVAPIMSVVPAVVRKPDGVLMSREGYAQGVTIGAGFMPNVGPIVYLGVFDRDGTHLVGAIPPHIQAELRRVLDGTLRAVAGGAYDRAAVAS